MAEMTEVEVVRKMSDHRASAGDALARSERALILTQAQLNKALALVRELRVDNDKLADNVARLQAQLAALNVTPDTDLEPEPEPEPQPEPQPELKPKP